MLFARNSCINDDLYMSVDTLVYGQVGEHSYVSGARITPILGGLALR